MQAKSIKVGGEYLTRVGEEKVRVRVVDDRGGSTYHPRHKYRLVRVDNGRPLPKARSAAALHPVGSVGHWPSMTEKQED